MENREILLDCALTLFSARGYDAVGIQEIVDSAGVTKPTLYHYFSHKRGLLDALLASQFEGLLDSVRTAAYYQRDLPNSLEKIARAYFEAAVENPRFFRLQLTMQYAPVDSEPNQAIVSLTASNNSRSCNPCSSRLCRITAICAAAM